MNNIFVYRGMLVKFDKLVGWFIQITMETNLVLMIKKPVRNLLINIIVKDIDFKQIFRILSHN